MYDALSLFFLPTSDSLCTFEPQEKILLLVLEQDSKF